MRSVLTLGHLRCACCLPYENPLALVVGVGVRCQVVGNLFASRRCSSTYSNGVCASYSTNLPTCGVSPSLSIPQAFLSAAYTGCTNSGNVSVSGCTGVGGWGGGGGGKQPLRRNV